MAIERLADEDDIMLWADELRPQDIGAPVILEGAGLFDSQGRFRTDDPRAAIASRLHLLPRLRQLLFVPPKEQGGPLWVDAPAFDLTEHVHVLSVPAPGGEAELISVAEQFVRSGLDRSRPLWQMWFLTGLPQGRAGWLVKVHHAIADGMAGVAIFGTLLDATPNTALAPPEPWTPTPAPTESSFWPTTASAASANHQRMLSSLAHPLATARQLSSAWPVMRELLAEPALARRRLEAVKQVANGSGAKVNDVLLAAVAGGLRKLLQHRGETVEGNVIRVYVVTLRPQEERARARGNQIAQMMVPLPIDKADPVQRLRQIASETGARRRPGCRSARCPTEGSPVGCS